MKKFIKNLLCVLLVITIIICIFNIAYSKLGYGSFSKAATIKDSVTFVKDDNVRYSNTSSYKIENKNYNNSAFYKKIKVKKNTPYKITCMIKTENVEMLDKSIKNSGAKISILNSKEQTMAITGSHDWQKVSLIVNSKNKEELEIAFMLGSDSDSGNVKGTAWFSDFQLEEGQSNCNNTWNVVCFIFKNTDVTLNEKNYKYQMSEKDIKQINDCMQRFKTTCSEFSENKMNVTYKIIEIDEPIDSLTYDNENGYYINSTDISTKINKYLDEDEYDHIFICARLSNENSEIPINHWLGLGSMEYRGIGYSNIRMPKSSRSYDYEYKEKLNTFPQEVFVHEFLHTLEQNSYEYGYDCPVLHENEKYGYKEKRVESLYEWYKDYMSEKIEYNGKKVGLNQELYSLKPVHESNFRNSIKLSDFEEPIGFIGKSKVLINTIKSKI